jgi:hypothetical protein
LNKPFGSRKDQGKKVLDYFGKTTLSKSFDRRECLFAVF